MGKVKKHINSFGANLGARLQVVSLLIGFFLPFALWSQLVKFIADTGLEKADFSDDGLKILYMLLRWLGKHGAWLMGICGLVLLIRKFRKNNKETMFNKGEAYKAHTYWWYWFCSKVLGYSKCSLEKVPIFMQFRLIRRATFKEYDLGDIPEENIAFGQCWLKTLNGADKEVNLIIADTYPIQVRQLPDNKRALATIKVYRIDESDHRRLYTRAFIECVTNSVRNLPEIEQINIFATTNPKNTYEIVRKAFDSGGRENIERIMVFQQEDKGERSFNEKGKIV